MDLTHFERKIRQKHKITKRFLFCLIRAPSEPIVSKAQLLTPPELGDIANLLVKFFVDSHGISKSKEMPLAM